MFSEDCLLIFLACAEDVWVRNRMERTARLAAFSRAMAFEFPIPAHIIIATGGDHSEIASDDT